MRVFCPEHKKGFFTPRQNPIKCENKGHILGELAFEGEARAPIELHWKYCCNCEHFCPMDFDKDGLERCPVCTRRSSMLYLCDRCFTITFESSMPIQTKNFTLTSEGVPQPSCPGCLQATTADLREHTCDVVGVSFTTALNSCPICQERLDLGPSFPSSVADYLRRTKLANKLNLTFDYETELFVPVEDGEFVLISNGNEPMQSIVLPRSERFATRRDFYDFYQDYYHCAKPDGGEVHIIQPASVTPTVAGWKLQAPGILEVLGDQPEKKAPANARRQVDTATRDETGRSLAAMNKQVVVMPCTHCGTVVETRYEYCWDCGNSLTPETDFSVTRPQPMKNEPSVTRSQAIMPVAESAAEDEELTVQHDVRPVRSPIFSSAPAEEPDRPTPGNSAMLRLIVIVVVGLVMVSLGIFVLTRSPSRMASVTAAQPINPDAQSVPTQAAGREVKGGVATENTPRRISAARPEDDELKRLREKRIAAAASDRSGILQAFASAEKQYPNDYRFPYERAKLGIREQESRSHAEAFNALTLAAEKAIKSGKALEMLDDLKVDKAGDFQKLSHGHHEWTHLADALKRNDTKLLNTTE